MIVKLSSRADGAARGSPIFRGVRRGRRPPSRGAPPRSPRRRALAPDRSTRTRRPQPPRSRRWRRGTTPRAPWRSAATASSASCWAPAATTTIWGPNVWIELAGHAVEEAEDLARPLRAPPRRAGSTRAGPRHYALVPASDAALVDAWFRLGVRPAARGTASARCPTCAWPDGGAAGRASRRRRARCARRRSSATIRRRRRSSRAASRPTIRTSCAPRSSPTSPRTRSANSSPSATRRSSAPSSRRRSRSRASTSGLARPDGAALLGWAATLPEVRGIGRRPRARPTASFAWARERGHETIVTDWRVDEPARVALLATPWLPPDVPPPVPRHPVVRVAMLSGSRVSVLTAPDDALLLRPPRPQEAIGDVGAAVRDSLRFPCPARRSRRSRRVAGRRRSSSSRRRCRCRVRRSIPVRRRSRPRSGSSSAWGSPRSGRRCSSPAGSSGAPEAVSSRPCSRRRRRVRSAAGWRCTTPSPTSSSRSGRPAARSSASSRHLVDADLVVTVTAAETVLHGGAGALSSAPPERTSCAARARTRCSRQRPRAAGRSRSPSSGRSRAERP